MENKKRKYNSLNKKPRLMSRICASSSLTPFVLSVASAKSKDADRAQPCFDSALRATLSMSGVIAKCTNVVWSD
jgi:hypothetical protein